MIRLFVRVTLFVSIREYYGGEVARERGEYLASVLKHKHLKNHLSYHLTLFV